MLVLVSAAAIALAPQIISLFLAADPQVQEIGTLALRLQCALIPLFAFTCLSNMMLQTMGIAGAPRWLAMARQGLFFIPAGMGAGACLWPPGRAAGTASGRCTFLPAGHSADAAGFAQAARERGCKKSFKDVNALPSFSVLSAEALSAMPRACGEGGEMPVKLGIVSYITQVLR